MQGQIEERKDQTRVGSNVVWLLRRPFGGRDRGPVANAGATERNERVSGPLMIKPSTHLRVAVGMHREDW